MEKIIVYILLGLMVLLMSELITNGTITYWIETRILRRPKNEKYEETRRKKK